MKASVFALALLAAISNAEEAEKWENNCFRCIDEGFAFCSSDGNTGTCHDVSCQEDELTGEEKEAAYGTCNPRANPCTTASNL